LLNYKKEAITFTELLNIKKIKKMKKIIYFCSLLAVSGLLFAFSTAKNTETEPSKVEWLDWETAVERNKTDKRPFMVDVYTDWCGWCKRMDRDAFSDAQVADFLNKNFHPVKFNAEMKKKINWNNHDFEWVEGGRNGVHMLAYSLLDGKMGYPAFVYLNEKMERIMISPGYKKAPDVMKELTFAKGGHYKQTSWEEYKRSSK